MESFVSAARPAWRFRAVSPVGFAAPGFPGCALLGQIDCLRSLTAGMFTVNSPSCYAALRACYSPILKEAIAEILHINDPFSQLLGQRFLQAVEHDVERAGQARVLDALDHPVKILARDGLGAALDEDVEQGEGLRRQLRDGRVLPED